MNLILNKLIPITKWLSEMDIPLSGVVSPGFPSKAYNYVEEGIDFNRMLIKLKETTFCLIAGGNSMKDDGVFKDDLLVVDKLAEPYENSIRCSA